MKKPDSIQILIPNPCNEVWDKMSDTSNGKFCHSCQHAVIDFTRFTDAQLYNFTIAHKDEYICGRFRQSQLNRVIPIPPQPHSRLYRLVIAAGLTILALVPMNNAKARFQPPYTVAHTVAADAEQSHGDSSLAVRGLVVDEKGEPMIGAVVQLFVDGLNKGGAATDIDGLFKIYPISFVPDAEVVIQVSYTSYVTQKVELNMNNISTQCEIQMEINTKEIEEVTVMGYRVPLIDIIPGSKFNQMAVDSSANQQETIRKGRIKTR